LHTFTKMAKITEFETIGVGINSTFCITGDETPEENKEKVLRNQIIDKIRAAYVTSDGDSKSRTYFPVVTILNGANRGTIKWAIKSYQELRKKFLENHYNEISFYDEKMGEATYYCGKTGLNSLLWEGGVN